MIASDILEVFMTEIIFTLFAAMIFLVACLAGAWWFLLNRQDVERDWHEDRLRMQRFIQKYQRHVDTGAKPEGPERDNPVR